MFRASSLSSGKENVAPRTTFLMESRSSSKASHWLQRSGMGVVAFLPHGFIFGVTQSICAAMIRDARVFTDVDLRNSSNCKREHESGVFCISFS